MRKKKKKKIQLILPGIEPGTLSVLDSCDNRYTTESTDNHGKEYCKVVANYPVLEEITKYNLSMMHG